MTERERSIKGRQDERKAAEALRELLADTYECEHEINGARASISGEKGERERRRDRGITRG